MSTCWCACTSSWPPPIGVSEALAQAGAQLVYYGGDHVEVVLLGLFCLDWYRPTAPPPPQTVASRTT